MHQMFFLGVVLQVLAGLAQDTELENDGMNEGELNCRERNRLITDDKDDLYNIVEVGLDEVTRLQCHFCHEEDDGHAKNWWRMDNFDDSKYVELVLDMDSDMDLNRVFMNSDHTLTIRNITEEDRGEYLCKGLDADELENDYLFYVDVVIPTDIQPEKGNMSDWRKYHDEQMSPINKYLNESKDESILYLANSLKVRLELETSWGRAGPCEICGRPKGDGRKFTEGHCRTKITHFETVSSVSNSSALRKLVDRATHLSCRSLTLNELVPDLINRTAYIPDFLLTEECDGICNPDAEGAYKGWRSTKKGFKYKKTFVLAENAHLTLICPDSTLENHVQWKINNRVIKAGESKVAPSDNVESRVFVDSFNTLYLYGVTKDEEGNYTCYVDKIRMQQVRVFVVSKSRLLTQAFLRHMIYLAFVLSLTLSCYGAGLIVTYLRRHKFKTYAEVRHELKAKHLLMEENLSELTIDSTKQKEDATTSISKAQYSPKRKEKSEIDEMREVEENATTLVGEPIREFDSFTFDEPHPVEKYQKEENLSSDSDIDEYRSSTKSLLIRYLRSIEDS